MVLLGFYRVLPSSDQFDWVLLDVTEFYLVSTSFVFSLHRVRVLEARVLERLGTELDRFFCCCCCFWNTSGTRAAGTHSATVWASLFIEENRRLECHSK